MAVPMGAIHRRMVSNIVGVADAPLASQVGSAAADTAATADLHHVRTVAPPSVPRPSASQPETQLPSTQACPVVTAAWPSWRAW